MVGMIRPLVKGRSSRAARALGLFWAGALLSSSTVGLAFSGLGLVVRPVLTPRLWALMVGGLAVVLALADLGVWGLRTPGFRQQTCSWWWQTMGSTKAWVGWGVHLGLGLATIRATSLYWLMAAMVVVLIPPVAGALVLSAYSVGLATSLGAMAVVVSVVRAPDGGARALLHSGGAIKISSSVFLVIFAIVSFALYG